MLNINLQLTDVQLAALKLAVEAQVGSLQDVADSDKEDAFIAELLLNTKNALKALADK